MPTTRLLALPGIVAVAVLAAGCTAPAQAPGPAPAGTQTTQQDAPAATPSGGVLTADPEKQGATAVGIDLTKPPAAIAMVKAPYSGKERITDVTVELIELRKRDALLYGIFRVTNTGDFTGEMTLYTVMGSGFEPSLVDTKNLKEYRPIAELSSRGLNRPEAKANQPMYVHTAWGYPEGVETIDIRVHESFPLMEGIPVP